MPVGTGDKATMAAARAALRLVREGDFVVSSATTNEPRYLIRALAERARELSSVRLAAGLFLSGYDFLSAPSLSFSTWFPPGPSTPKSVRARINYLPLGWSQAVGWLLEREIDVLLLQVSAADEAGYHSFGLSSSYAAPAVERARKIIAEVNPRMPFTHGKRIHGSAIDEIVEVDDPVAAYPTSMPSETDRTIGSHVAALISDGATLQVGVGTIPDASLAAVAERGARDIRLHSTLTAGALRLVEADAIAADPGAIRVGDVLGDEPLYRWLDRNPAVQMVDARDTHDARALARIQQFVSVGSAFSVDLYGQVNVEYVREEHAGAIGGAADFVRAGAWPGNLSIIALPSTTRDGSTSRIVPRLDAPTVSITRDVVRYVVTEFGVADLADKTVRERARELARIAHPKFRRDWEGRP